MKKITLDYQALKAKPEVVVGKYVWFDRKPRLVVDIKYEWEHYFLLTFDDGGVMVFSWFGNHTFCDSAKFLTPPIARTTTIARDRRTSVYEKIMAFAKRMYDNV